MLRLKVILQIFECISGFKVNLSKSSIAGIGVEDSLMTSFAGLLGCKVENWPLSYLGMPLGGNPQSLSFRDPVVERVQKKLATWKRNHISLGGRITLIKAALANTPVYYMSLF